jgi:hypothetical protein
MTLLLPVLDYARSPRALVALIDRHVPPGACVRAPGMARAQVAALEVFGQHRVRTQLDSAAAAEGCDHLLLAWRGNAPTPPPPPGWSFEARLRRPGERNEQVLVYSRHP